MIAHQARQDYLNVSSNHPHGWAATTIGDIAETSSGFGFPEKFQGKASGKFPFAKVRDISFAFKNTNGRLSAADNFVDEATLQALKARPVPAGSTVFAKIGEALRLNRRVILNVEAVLDNNCMAVTPDVRVTDAEFLYRFLTTVDLSPFAVATTVPSVRRGDVTSISLNLPPVFEQRRIVSKIDSLSAKSRRVRERLDHILRLVEKYKQAVLTAAFRGDLTREWRAKNAHNRYADHHSNQIDARLSELPDLPSKWWWQAISEVMGISGGLTKNPKRSAMAMRRPYLRVANVYANELRLAEISETGCTDKEFEKTKLVAGDLLIVEGNGSLEQIGRVAIWNDEVGDCSHQNHIIRARPSEVVEPRFALFWLLSPAGRQAIEAVASSSSGLHTLSITKVGGLPIPLCTKPEQLAIVRLIENAFAWIERLTSETTSARKLIDHLDQAILAKAFRGELVPQDANDKPASVLLEQIKAERGATAHPRSRKRRDKLSRPAAARSRKVK
jgi:type I restriction enzyme S subunit